MTQVSAQLEYDVVEAATVVLQLGVASGTGHLSILNNGATVTAEYIGGGQMIEAPHTGAVVQLSSIWSDDLAGFGRVHR